jgi:flagellar basal-body rod modification protein FlgD
MTTPVAGTTGTSTYTASSGSPTAKQQTMNSEVFLQLLVTQLRNQDPSSPMDTNEMMAQTTALASMEQLTTLTGLTDESFSLQMRAAASALLGQTVEYVDDDKVTKSGTVTSVSFADKVPMVTVDGKSIRLDALMGARAAA